MLTCWFIITYACMLGKEIIAFIIYKIHRVSSMRLLSMRQPIKKHRVVPRYQNLEKIVGFCDFLFKPLSVWGEVW